MPEDLTSEQIHALQDALLRLRADVATLLAGSKEAAAPVDLDQPIGRVSRMDAMQQQSMVSATRRGARVRQQQIEAALARIDEDTYGACLNCDEPVGFPRLEATPEAPFCVGCQSLRESPLS